MERLIKNLGSGSTDVSILPQLVLLDLSAWSVGGRLHSSSRFAFANLGLTCPGLYRVSDCTVQYRRRLRRSSQGIYPVSDLRTFFGDQRVEARR